MGILTSRFKKLDWGLVVPTVLLVCFGLAGIWGTCVAKDNFSRFDKQVVFFILGFLLMIAISFLDYRTLKNNSYFILILSL